MRHRRVAIRCAVALWGAAILVAAGTLFSDAVADAATTLKVDRQDSQADTPVNPYTDTDLHVAFQGGTQTQHSYVHISFAGVPSGETIDQLTLTFTQSSSTTGNVNAQNAALEACPLTTELPANYDPSNPPQWDCQKASVPGEGDGNGGWRFDLQPLVDVWDRTGDTGAAILALPSPLSVGSQLGPTANNWAVALDPTQTKATADVMPADSSSSGGGSVSLTPAIAQPAAPLAAAPLSLPPVAPTPRPGPLPAPPSAAPAHGTSPSGSTAAAPAAAPAGPGVSRGWVIAGVLLALGAVVAVAGVGLRQVALHGSLSVAGLLASLGSARSRLATPVAVLSLAAVLAFGFASREAGTAAGPGLAATGSGATAQAGGGTEGAGTGPAAPGAPGAAAPGSSAATASGPAAQASGAAAAAAAAASAGRVPLPRGVTPTTVRIGFFEATNQNTVNHAAGINGLNNTGDEQTQAMALVKWINSHGGIAGHAIDPRFIPEDASNTDPTYQTQLCHQAVDDYQVFAIVDGNSALEDAAQCYMSSHTLYFAEGLTEFSAATQESWGAYYWSPSGPNLDRSTAETLDGLRTKGFFTSKDKVGFMYEDMPSTHQTIDRIVMPRLQAMGYDPNSVVTVGVTPPIADANGLSAINNGMLKMKTSGVTKLFYVDDAGTDLAVFSMRDADNLQYHTVSYGLQSQDGLDAVAYLEPSDQLQNSVGVGYWNWADTSTANSDGFPESPAESQCLKIMNAAGIPTPNPPGRDGEATAQMSGLCDSLFLLYLGSEGLGQNLNAPAFSAAAERLGTSFQGTENYPGGSFVGPGHHDTDNSYRLLHWDPSCTNGYDGGTGKGSSGCFKFDSRTSYRSPEV